MPGAKRCRECSLRLAPKMSYAFLRGLGVIDPPASSLLVEEEDAAPIQAVQSSSAVIKPQPPPSWKRRNQLNEFKKCLSRKGCFPEGDGEEKYADGSVYKGQRSRGKRHGQGCFWWPDRGLYVGFFHDGFMHGLGEIRYPSGGRYNGEFKLGKRSGLGGYLYSRQTCEPHAEYLGQWEEDRPHGWGLRLSKDDGVYLGAFDNGLRHGRGISMSKKNESKRRGAAAEQAGLLS
jgi:hypothetical protein